MSLKKDGYDNEILKRRGIENIPQFNCELSMRLPSQDHPDRRMRRIEAGEIEGPLCQGNGNSTIHWRDLTEDEIDKVFREVERIKPGLMERIQKSND